MADPYSTYGTYPSWLSATPPDPIGALAALAAQRTHMSQQQAAQLPLVILRALALRPSYPDSQMERRWGIDPQTDQGIGQQPPPSPDTIEHPELTYMYNQYRDARQGMDLAGGGYISQGPLSYLLRRRRYR